MKERILITGASGFIGYHLIESALAEGMEVYAAVRPSSDVSHLKDLDVQYLPFNFGSKEDIQKQLEEKQFQYIVHAAGTTKAKDQQAYDKINAEYTRNIAQAAADANIPLKKFVFMSSLAAIGPTTLNAVDAIDEKVEPHPLTSYGRSKLLAEKYLSEIDLPLITLRPTAVYGPREKDIFIMFKTLNSGLEPYIGSRGQFLTFIYATDLADAVMLALKSPVSKGTYHISDGKKYDRYVFSDIIKKALNKKTLKFHVPMGIVRVIATVLEKAYQRSGKSPALNREKLGELTAENWDCSIVKIKNELGFAPVYDLEKGLNETVRWYKQHKWL